MLILKKHTNSDYAVINTDAVAWIRNEGSSIWINERVIERYNSNTRAKEVLLQIFNAMKNGEKVFEIPEV